jgi:hypothetical protein
MADGHVRLRSNVLSEDVRDTLGWRIVPGELVATYRKELLRPPNKPPQLQHDERMYYVPCTTCGRNASEIALEGCDECSQGPRPLELEENRARHAQSVAALEAARAELAARAAAVEAARLALRTRPRAVSAKPVVMPTVEEGPAAPPRVAPQAQRRATRPGFFGGLSGLVATLRARLRRRRRRRAT